ncbi:MULTISPECIES: 2,3-diphosphoglycerate-dependent phosphoglycerate mutase [unclassified Romboutsia]|uniref:2,3-diphosphoglycerate-dependent phosphoglycerate mutase n=1 Tax=unclassified Romboutsia TaxID=2626894 RepID=UPI00082272CE|nr:MULTISPECIES: 2,3-diphosphoglycerate-dependent phosphoglycerate mutase [unclassified Romboutsia]SCH46769.1 2%2C3-bisphosphoglycerate-dependent phosphoglycerate mutase [uncultured Clostridium sp.]
MRKIVLIRHGQSLWNLENKFTGWTDVDLSENGLIEARKAGKILSEYGYEFDMAYTSVLKRSIRTLWIILDEMNLMWIPVYKSWKLNERHYGALQGLNKDEIAKKYGKEKVKQWRRSVNIAPPSLTIDDNRYSGNDTKYKHLPKDKIPFTESLKDTEKRVIEEWYDEIVSSLKYNKKIIISAHGNTLRALVKYLDNIEDDDIENMNIPTGIPLVYELDDDLKPIRHYYLSSEGEVEEKETAKSI